MRNRRLGTKRPHQEARPEMFLKPMKSLDVTECHEFLNMTYNQKQIIFYRG